MPKGRCGIHAWDVSLLRVYACLGCLRASRVTNFELTALALHSKRWAVSACLCRGHMRGWGKAGQARVSRQCDPATRELHRPCAPPSLHPAARAMHAGIYVQVCAPEKREGQRHDLSACSTWMGDRPRWSCHTVLALRVQLAVQGPCAKMASPLPCWCHITITPPPYHRHVAATSLPRQFPPAAVA